MQESRAKVRRDFRSLALSASCSIEILAQNYLFWTIFAPVAILLIPAVLIGFSLQLLVNFLGETFENIRFLSALVEHNLVIIVVVVGFICLIGTLWNFYLGCPVHALERRLRSPSGRAGALLLDTVADLWRGFPGARGSTPEVFWFPNFNVMASAIETGNANQIHVSSALWERATKQDIVAIGILAHEMVHILYHDRRKLCATEIVVKTVDQIFRIAVLILFVTSMILVFDIIARGIIADQILVIVQRMAAIFAALALFLFIPWLIGISIRRLAALISALIEVRADATAGIWTNGVEGFGLALSKDPGIRTSSFSDIRHSFVSPDITHLHNIERIALLGDNVRLTTPKLRYFALTLALAFLLPLNPYTPLIEGGAFDHLLIASTVVVAHMTTVAMIIVAAPALRTPLPLRSVLLLAVFLCIATMLPRINMYEVGYLLTNEVVRLALPGGFGGDEQTWSDVANDVVITAGGLSKKIMAASGGLLIVVAIGCSAICLLLMSVVARQVPRSVHFSKTKLILIPLITCALITTGSVFDEWRSEFFSVFPLSLAEDWSSITSSVPWFRLCAPELVSLLAFVIQLPVLKAISLSNSA